MKRNKRDQETAADQVGSIRNKTGNRDTKKRDGGSCRNIWKKNHRRKPDAADQVGAVLCDNKNSQYHFRNS